MSVQHGPTWPGPVCQCGYEPNGWAPNREDCPRLSLYLEAQNKARAESEAALARQVQIRRQVTATLALVA
jgi:hypothetical protein